jgi:hypothetical protein
VRFISKQTNLEGGPWRLLISIICTKTLPLPPLFGYESNPQKVILPFFVCRIIASDKFLHTGLAILFNPAHSLAFKNAHSQ